MVAATPQAGEVLARALAAADTDTFVDAVCRVVAKTATPRRTRSFGVLLRAILDETEEVERLAGPPAVVVSSLDGLLLDTRIQSEAHRAVLDESMLDSAAVGAALGHRGLNPREQASDLRRRSILLGVRSGRRYLYPAFQINAREHRVHATVAAVNSHLDAAGDAWAVASWWGSPHPRLGWAAPKDLVDTDRDRDLLLLAGIGSD